MSARIPFDDHKLEMEEIEGFLPAQDTANKIDVKPLGNRWSCAMLTIGIFLGILFMSDTEYLRFWEGNSGERLVDVQEKPDEEPLSAPSFKPTDGLFSAATALPSMASIIQSVVPETSQPTYTVTNMETLQPTDAVTEKPTDPITEVITPQPTDPVTEVITPQSNDIINTTDTSQPTHAVILIDTPQPTGTYIAKGIEGAIPKEDINDPNIDFSAAHYPKPSYVVKPDPPLTLERAEALAQEWGKWEFVDHKADQRPKEDYCAQFLQRDIPRDAFPSGAWQTDTEYLERYLDQGTKLVDRAMEAILAEYGHGAKDDPGKSFEDREKDMFQWIMYPPGESPGAKNLVQEGGWTTEKSFQGLVRRLLHTIMTRDAFTAALGGHSGAAGHGNLFKQSYMMQFHKVLEPVFGLLGVELRSHNFAQGGLGTIQHSLGFSSIYGDNIDFMIWDSGMTEGRDPVVQDLFWRQAILSGDRVPFLMGAGSVGHLLYFNQNVGADFGNYGDAIVGLPTCIDEIQCDKFPWATRYIKCGEESLQMCGNHKFLANCWVEREDVTPTEPQDPNPGSQVSWHPGFRVHQLTGRNLAFFVLKALKTALMKWKNSDNFSVPDSEWHMSDYYSNIRSKLKATEGQTPCFTSDAWPSRVCSTKMRAFTEFQPRVNPDKTSLLSALKPAANGFKPRIHPGNLYNGPDVFNPFTAIPEGEIDVFAIVSNGRTFDDESNQRRALSDADIEPGLGEEVGNNLKPGYCDGSYNSECGRQGNCLLSGHGDSRGCLLFNSYSGWLVFTLPNLTEGIIISKVESWHSASEIPEASSWHSINNQRHRRHLRRRLRRLHGMDVLDYNMTSPVDNSSSEMMAVEEVARRKLKQTPPAYCDNFRYEFAIDGVITSWNVTEFTMHDKVPQRVVELQLLLDDANFTSEPRDVELAIRMTGCGDTTQKTFCLSHIYYA